MNYQIQKKVILISSKSLGNRIYANSKLSTTNARVWDCACTLGINQSQTIYIMVWAEITFMAVALYDTMFYSISCLCYCQ